MKAGEDEDVWRCYSNRMWFVDSVGTVWQLQKEHVRTCHWAVIWISDRWCWLRLVVWPQYNLTQDKHCFSLCNDRLLKHYFTLNMVLGLSQHHIKWTEYAVLKFWTFLWMCFLHTNCEQLYNTIFAKINLLCKLVLGSVWVIYYNIYWIMLSEVVLTH